MGAPSEVNARNYGTEYFVVVSPGANSGLKMDQIRHAYLHYLVDPIVGRFSANLSTLDPLLDAVKLAPMDESFKSDASLLVTECVIRSIEARAQERLTAGDAAGAEKLAKQALAEKAEDPGRALFILAQISLHGNMDGARDYFEQALKATTEPRVVAWSHIYLGRILDLQDRQEN